VSSSTSSFRTELKVIAVVLAVVAIFEIAARFMADDLSDDRAHIHGIPEISRRLDEAPGRCVLFLGNSLSLHGVDAALVAESLKDVTVDRVIPVGTDVTDWIYIYRRYFGNVDRNPDVVVVGFVRHHVRDLKPPKRIRRLGRHFLSFDNEMEIFTEDVHDYDDRAELVLSQVSSCFGDQLFYNEWVLAELLPWYHRCTKRLNWMLDRVQKRIAKQRLAGRPPPAPTFDRVARLAKIFRENGTRGVFVAMPLPEVWEMDPEVQKAVEAEGMTFVDARAIGGMVETDFSDGYHMGESGREKFSRFIAKIIGKCLEQAGKN